MKKLVFEQNDAPSLGVEIEVALVDGQTMALRSCIGDVLKRLPSEYEDCIKPELMQCYLEINSCVCGSVGDVERDMRPKIEAVEGAADELDVRLLWSATHPFSLWQDQQITPTERYHMLVDLLQDQARQLVTFGLHVHVGVDSGDKAVMICDRIMSHLPTLLALSCNSPCWDGRVTGLQSSRSKVMEGLPTAGLPFVMRNWSEYTWLVNHLIETGFIHTIREIWWDVRPHHNFGTVEVRVCDVPGSFQDVLALAALIQCLVKSLSDEIDEGTYLAESHPMMVRQNKWRACRYGPRAMLVDPVTHESRPVSGIAEGLVRCLWPIAEELECREHLQRVLGMATGPSWADRQLQLLEETGDPAEAVRRLTAMSRLTSRNRKERAAA
jgi:glutamate---cysteine ligase / carboxylate-amine ligase